jgi:hypothetical protein
MNNHHNEENGQMDLSLSDEEEITRYVLDKALTHDWWIIEFYDADGHHLMSEIESAYYMGDANGDFELIMHPAVTVVLAHKRRMTAAQLAALMRSDAKEAEELGQVLSHRDIVAIR